MRSKNSYYHLPKLNERKFEADLAKKKPDVVFIIGFAYKFISPRFLLKLKQSLNIKLYLYDTDSCNLYSRNREFIYFLENELPIYDKIFSFSEVTTSFFKNSQELDAIHIPFGASSIDIKKSEKKNDIFFVGNADLRRIFLLEHLKGFNLKVLGARWERNTKIISKELKQKISDRTIWGEELHDELFSSKIVLNITRDSFYGVETGINLRIFESLAAGAFLLTDYCEELESVLKVGEEIETYRSASELRDKVDFYLRNERAREKIANQGHERFLKDYTWAKIVNRLSSEMYC